MRRSALTVLTFAALVLIEPLPSLAQQVLTVGDLLDKGGNQLSGTELIALFSGSTEQGTQNLAKFQSRFLSDGKITGTFQVPGQQPGTFLGSWSVSNANQVCIDWKNTAGQRGGGCSYYYVVGGKYYSSKADGRQSTLKEREFTK